MISDDAIRKLCAQVRTTTGLQQQRIIDELRRAVQQYLQDQNRSNGELPIAA